MRRHFLYLAPILLLSAFLQFYRLGEWQHFQGDEGNLVLVARVLFLEHHLPVTGMPLAVGSAHLGPLFNYLVAVPLWLSGLDPTSAVAMIGAFQVLTVALIYWFCLRWIGGPLSGWVAALVYATSQLIVYYNRFLWPNFLPFFVLLILWSLLAIREGGRSLSTLRTMPKGRERHWALLGIWLGVALQLQPTSVLLAPFVALFFLLFRPPLPRWRFPLLGLGAMALLFAPDIVNDLTHGLVETRAWLGYAHHGNGTHTRALLPTVQRIGVLVQRLLGLHERWQTAAVLVLLGVGLAMRAHMPSCARPFARLLLLYIGVYVGGYLFFGTQLRPHYLIPLYPAPALLLALLVGQSSRGHDGSVGAVETAAISTEVSGDMSPLRGSVFRRAPGRADLLRAARGVVVVVAVLVAMVNVRHTWAASFMPDRYMISLLPQRSNLITIAQMRQVRDYIIQQAQRRQIVSSIRTMPNGEPFNLTLLAPDDTSDAYRALLLAAHAPYSPHPAPLLFVVVQPADWAPQFWPPDTRSLLACQAVQRQTFAAGVVWQVRLEGPVSSGGYLEDPSLAGFPCPWHTTVQKPATEASPQR